MDKKEALKQIKAGDLDLDDVDKKLQADKEFVLAAVKQNGWALEYADKKLKADKEVVLAAVKESGDALQYADKKLKADKEVVLIAVKENGEALRYATKSLISDLGYKKIKIEVEGQGQQYYFQEISKQTYDFYKDEDGLLCNAVTGNGDGDDLIGDLPTYYEESQVELLGFEIGNSSLEVYCDGESQTIKLSEENIKKLGINCKTKSVNMEDIIKSKEGFVFLAHEELGGINNNLPVLYEEETFDPKKLSLTITNFKWNTCSTRFVTHLGYGNKQTDNLGVSEGGGEAPEFELFKVLKK